MDNVLKKEHLDILKKLAESCDNTRQFLQTCQDSHLNVDEEIQRNEEQAKICDALRRNFFPNSA